MHYKSETCLTGIYHNYLFKSIYLSEKKEKKSKRNGKHLGYSMNYLLAKRKPRSQKSVQSMEG